MADDLVSEIDRRWRTARLVCAWLSRIVEGSDAAGPAFAWPVEPDATERVIAYASRQLVTPALGWALRDEPTLPTPVREYLDAALYLNGERNARLLDGLASALDRLAAIGVTPVLLKGAASLADGLYPAPAARFLTDLDLLVPRESARAAAEALDHGGFATADCAPPWVRVKHHHLPPQYDGRTGAWVELHVSAVPDRFADMAPADSIRREASPIDFRGRRVLTPSPAHRVIHCIVHDQLVDGAFVARRANVRQVLELALLLVRRKADLDLRSIEATFDRAGQSAALAYARGLAAVLGATAPTGLAGAAIARLEDGFRRPRSAGRDLLAGYARRACRHPLTVLNLLQPSRWRRRLTFIAEQLRG